jgi:NADH-quinone oxidoreductase subunit F
MGTPLREIIYTHAGGIPNGRTLKGVIPGGASMPDLHAGRDRRPDGHGLRAEGRLVPRLRRHHGDGRHRLHGVDAPRPRALLPPRVVRASARRAARGTGWLKKVLLGLEYGNANPSDVDLLLNIAAT